MNIQISGNLFGPTVFFLAGWPDTSDVFRTNIMAALEEDYRIVGLTLPTFDAEVPWFKEFKESSARRARDKERGTNRTCRLRDEGRKRDTWRSSVASTSPDAARASKASSTSVPAPPRKQGTANQGDTLFATPFLGHSFQDLVSLLEIAVDAAMSRHNFCTQGVVPADCLVATNMDEDTLDDTTETPATAAVGLDARGRRAGGVPPRGMGCSTSKIPLHRVPPVYTRPALIAHDWGCVLGYELLSNRPYFFSRIVALDVGAGPRHHVLPSLRPWTPPSSFSARSSCTQAAAAHARQTAPACGTGTELPPTGLTCSTRRRTDSSKKELACNVASASAHSTATWPASVSGERGTIAPDAGSTGEEKARRGETAAAPASPLVQFLSILSYQCFIILCWLVTPRRLVHALLRRFCRWAGRPEYTALPHCHIDRAMQLTYRGLFHQRLRMFQRYRNQYSTNWYIHGYRHSEHEKHYWHVQEERYRLLRAQLALSSVENDTHTAHEMYRALFTNEEMGRPAMQPSPMLRVGGGRDDTAVSSSSSSRRQPSLPRTRNDEMSRGAAEWRRSVPNMRGWTVILIPYVQLPDGPRNGDGGGQGRCTATEAAEDVVCTARRQSAPAERPRRADCPPCDMPGRDGAGGCAARARATDAATAPTAASHTVWRGYASSALPEALFSALPWTAPRLSTRIRANVAPAALTDHSYAAMRELDEDLVCGHALPYATCHDPVCEAGDDVACHRRLLPSPTWCRACGSRDRGGLPVRSCHVERPRLIRYAGTRRRVGRHRCPDETRDDRVDDGKESSGLESVRYAARRVLYRDFLVPPPELMRALDRLRYALPASHPLSKPSWTRASASSVRPRGATPPSSRAVVVPARDDGGGAHETDCSNTGGAPAAACCATRDAPAGRATPHRYGWLGMLWQRVSRGVVARHGSVPPCEARCAELEACEARLVEVHPRMGWIYARAWSSMFLSLLLCSRGQYDGGGRLGRTGPAALCRRHHDDSAHSFRRGSMDHVDEAHPGQLPASSTAAPATHGDGARGRGGRQPRQRNMPRSVRATHRGAVVRQYAVRQVDYFTSVPHTAGTMGQDEDETKSAWDTTGARESSGTGTENSSDAAYGVSAPMSRSDDSCSNKNNKDRNDHESRRVSSTNNGHVTKAAAAAHTSSSLSSRRGAGTMSGTRMGCVITQRYLLPLSIPILYMYGGRKKVMFHSQGWCDYIVHEKRVQDGVSNVIEVTSGGHWFYAEREHQEFVVRCICEFLLTPIRAPS